MTPSPSPAPEREGSIEEKLKSERDSLALLLNDALDRLAACHKEVANLQSKLRDIQSAARVFDVSIEVNIPEKMSSTIRDRVLDYLHTKSSAKSSEIKKYLEESFSLRTHPKTIGMTLYRLSQDGIVTRQGRNWSIAEGRTP